MRLFTISLLMFFGVCLFVIFRCDYTEPLPAPEPVSAPETSALEPEVPEVHIPLPELEIIEEEAAAGAGFSTEISSVQDYRMPSPEIPEPEPEPPLEVVEPEIEPIEDNRPSPEIIEQQKQKLVDLFNSLEPYTEHSCEPKFNKPGIIIDLDWIRNLKREDL